MTGFGTQPLRLHPLLGDTFTPLTTAPQALVSNIVAQYGLPVKFAPVPTVPFAEVPEDALQSSAMAEVAQFDVCVQPRIVMPFSTFSVSLSPIRNLPTPSWTTCPGVQLLMAVWICGLSSIPLPSGVSTRPQMVVRFGMPSTDCIPHPPVGVRVVVQWQHSE